MRYTGIGSRQTPAEDLAVCHLLAKFLASRGWTLRSGGAAGADTAFEAGAAAQANEIYLPWKGFNSHTSELCHVTEDAIAESLRFHPTPGRLKFAARRLMGRNLYQVLGLDRRTPSRFVVCWTPFDTEAAFDPRQRIGGTGQALRIARHYEIPIYNLRDKGTLDTLRRDLPWLESLAPRTL